jgi:hypothetical protein
LNDLMVAELLNEVLQSGEVDKTALLIAQLAPGSLGNPEVADMMFGMLADRDLGASAAMVLSKSQDPEVQVRLDEVASGNSGLSRQRARLAIGIRRSTQESGS